MQDEGSSSFMHRGSMWKPWINSAWSRGDNEGRERSLLWLEEVWSTLETVCPGVHLAQMHPHIHWHKKELKGAFRDWLPELQKLKAECDPNGLLPTL